MLKSLNRTCRSIWRSTKQTRS